MANHTVGHFAKYGSGQATQTSRFTKYGSGSTLQTSRFAKYAATTPEPPERELEPYQRSLLPLLEENFQPSQPTPGPREGDVGKSVRFAKNLGLAGLSDVLAGIGESSRRGGGVLDPSGLERPAYAPPSDVPGAARAFGKRRREEAAETGGPETGAGLAAALVTGGAIEMAPYVVAGLLAPAPTTASAALRFAAAEAPAVALDVAQGLYRVPEETMAGVLSEVLSSPRARAAVARQLRIPGLDSSGALQLKIVNKLADGVEQLSKTPQGRALTEVILGVIPSSTLATLGPYTRRALNAAKDPLGVSGAASRGIAEGVEDAGQPMAAAVDQLPSRPLTEPPVGQEAAPRPGTDVRAETAQAPSRFAKYAARATPEPEPTQIRGLLAPPPEETASPRAAPTDVPEPSVAARPFSDLTDDELEAKWRQYQRGAARVDALAADADISLAPRRFVTDDGQIGLARVGGSIGEDARVNARGSRSQAQARIAAVESELARRGIEPPRSIYEGVGRSDVGAGNKDLVGRGGRNLDALGEEDVAREIQQTKAAWETNRVNADLNERMALLFDVVERRFPRLADRFGGVDMGLVHALARPGAGGAVGAAADEENRLRGAAIGGLGALGLPTAVRSVRSLGRRAGGRAAYLDNPSVKVTLRTVGRTPSEPAGALGRLRTSLAQGIDKLETRIFDEAKPLKDVGEKLEGTGRLRFEATRAKGFRGAAGQRLRDELAPVLRAAAGHEEGVMALTKAERGLELLDAGLEKTGLDRKVLEETAQVLSTVPEVRRASDMLRAYYRDLLDRKLVNGVITREQHDRIVAGGQAYIPFVREVSDDLEFGAAQFHPDGRLKSGATGIRRMGQNPATAPTVDPFKQAIDDTFETERRVSKQRVTNLLAEIIDQNAEEADALGLRFVDSATAGQRGARVTPVNVNGERRWLEIGDREIWNAFASFEPYVGNIFVQALRKPKTLLREGVTVLPDFGIANAIRDNIMAAIQHPYLIRESLGGGTVGGLIGAGTAEPGERAEGALAGGLMGMGMGGTTPHIARTLAAVGDIIGNREIYREWIREGGSGFGFYPRTKRDAGKVLAELKRTGVKPTDVVMPRTWWEALRSFNRVLEEATRLSRYKFTKDTGALVPEAISGARDVSLDFARIGSHMKGVSAMTAFFNAQLQGWNKLYRMLKDPKTWGTAGALITAPTVGLWLVNKDNPEYWERPAWERNLFWLVPKSGGQGFWRIPKPFEVGLIFASMPERLLDFAYKRDPESLKFGLENVASNYGVSALLPIPTGIEPILENVTDHKFFFNRPVDPYQYNNLPPEMQFTERTSFPAIALGRATGRSPAKIENLIRGVGGSAAGEVLEQSSRLAKALGVDERPQPAEQDIPLLGRFQTRATTISEQEILLRRRIDRAQKARNAARRLLRDGQPEAARRYVERHRAELEEYEGLRSVSNFLDDAREVRRQIERSEAPPGQKLEAIRELNRRVGGVADAVLNLSRTREKQQQEFVANR